MNSKPGNFMSRPYFANLQIFISITHVTGQPEVGAEQNFKWSVTNSSRACIGFEVALGYSVYSFYIAPICNLLYGRDTK